MKRSPLATRLFQLSLVAFPLALVTLGDGEEEPRLSLGRELFTRVWLPGDSRSHGGDGLGPVFNDSSCVACHNQGGCGGGGSVSKNIQFLSPLAGEHPKGPGGSGEGDVTITFGAGRLAKVEEPLAKMDEEVRSALVKFHPGFRESEAVVLHRFSTDTDYGDWLETRKLGRGDLPRSPVRSREAAALAKVAGRTIVLSERNPSALFGAGVIEAIPDEVIEAGASRKHAVTRRFRSRFAESLAVTGRVSRLKDGRVGRFGWKAQMASLEDFTRAACAVELGLEVPGQHQAGLPHRPDYRAPGADLTGAELASLVAFVRSLPAPRVGVFPPRSPQGDGQRAPSDGDGTAELGQALFAKVGCAACHVPDLGPAKGVYSDLLLHDMGGETAGAGSYGAFTPDEVAGAGPEKSRNAQDRGKEVLATPGEWRTPPLWGVRDSAPYLHDGRADTLEEAILLHGGEARRSADLFGALPRAERDEVLAFLGSLVAPE